VGKQVENGQKLLISMVSLFRGDPDRERGVISKLNKKHPLVYQQFPLEGNKFRIYTSG